MKVNCFWKRVRNAKLWNVEKNVEKNSQNVKCNNIEKTLFLMFCTFLYSKRNVESQNVKIKNVKTCRPLGQRVARCLLPHANLCSSVTFLLSVIACCWSVITSFSTLHEEFLQNVENIFFGILWFDVSFSNKSISMFCDSAFLRFSIWAFPCSC